MLRGAHPEKAQTVLKKNGKDGKSILHKQVHKGKKSLLEKQTEKPHQTPRGLQVSSVHHQSG